MTKDNEREIDNKTEEEDRSLSLKKKSHLEKGGGDALGRRRRNPAAKKA